MERIGEYLVRRLVGEGGMGKVFEAEERLSKRRVALKVLRPELARSEAGRRLFLNEMTILANLDHPNVVRCLACTEVDGELVMALEFLEGKTLRDIIYARGRVPWPEAVGLVVQMAAALGAAHSQTPPIIHRDLKPENAILLPSGKVKVMDFGIAKVLEAISSTTTHSVGTLQYMSPEQIDATGVDARSDLYCLGLVFYELLAGRPPFESASPRELLNLQCTTPAPPLPEEVRAGLPRGVERLIFQLLHKRPEDRPGSAGDVLTALEPFGSASAVSAPASTGPTIPASAGTQPGYAAAATPVPATATPHPGGTVPAAQGSGGTAPAPGGTVPGPGGTVPAHGGTAPAGPVVQADSVPPVSAAGPALAQRPRGPSDTIGLIEKASAQRRVPLPVALAIILGLSAVAGGITYLIRTSSSGNSDTATTASASPGAEG